MSVGAAVGQHRDCTDVGVSRWKWLSLILNSPLSLLRGGTSHPVYLLTAGVCYLLEDAVCEEVRKKVTFTVPRSSAQEVLKLCLQIRALFQIYLQGCGSDLWDEIAG